MNGTTAIVSLAYALTCLFLVAQVEPGRGRAQEQVHLTPQPKTLQHSWPENGAVLWGPGKS